jgi:glutathione S-transferase
MKLFFAAPSPFARKIRVLVRELELEGLVEEVVAHTTPVSPSEEVTAVNPLSKIPTLITAEGTSYFDSRVIAEYLASLRPETRINQQSGDARWGTLRRQALADGILDAGLLHRYETILRPESYRWPEWLEGQHGKILRGMSALSKDVPPIAQHVGIDAIATACALAWLEYRMPTVRWRSAHPELSDFLDAMSMRRSMRETSPEL